MVREGKVRIIVLLASLLLASAPSFAQKTERTDSLVRLMNAKSIEQFEQDGDLIRKSVDATFLHNGTYLICDTALWSLGSRTINCVGHVKAIQGDTELTGNELDYYIDEDLAKFNEGLVQMHNKKDNILRTNYLDYNTRDSVATFNGGASMRSADGQIIESDNGTYNNSTGVFNFLGEVNMYTDSVFVRTSSLEYDSNRDIAHFTAYIDFWKEDNMLSAGGGWYDRKAETFFFKDDVHGQSKDQETWCDSLYYYRSNDDIKMLGSAQVQDTTRSVAALADYMLYEDAKSRVTLQKQAAVAMWREDKEKGQMDTLYCGADKIVYETIMKCDIDSTEFEAAKARLEEMNGDSVSEFRKRAAAEAQKAAAEAKKNKEKGNKSGLAGMDEGENPMAAGGVPAVPAPAKPQTGTPENPENSATPPADSLGTKLDSLGTSGTPPDQIDTIAPPRDTTKIGFLYGFGNVKAFREDMQMACDSLVYNDLDSIGRCYKDPIVWNEGKRQYTADSLFVLIRNKTADRASLMSNAFIAVQEDSLHFDQIKSTDVMAYFDEDTNLRRFDALGGANAMFYLEENDVLATVNKVDSKIISATMKNGDLDEVYYFESPKNDAYPIVQLPASEQRLKGFVWRPENRPESPLDITTLEIKPSERSYYDTRPHTTFRHTATYFPGYMDSVYKQLREARIKRQTAHNERNKKDSLSLQGDSLAVSDSLAELGGASLSDSTATADSLSIGTQIDSLSAGVSKTDGDFEGQSASELKKAVRTAKRDAKWAAADKKDAEKAAAKAAKKQARADKKAARLAAKQAVQDAKDLKKLKKFAEHYQNQKDKNEGKQQSEASGERSSGAEAGGELPASSESGEKAS